jgi:hypothetical protein
MDILDEVALAQDKAAVLGWIADMALLSRLTVEECSELFASIRGIAPRQPLAVLAPLKSNGAVKYARQADMFMPVIGHDDDVCEVMREARGICRTVMPVFILESDEPLILDRACAALLCGGGGVAFDCRTPDTREAVFNAGEKLAQAAGILRSEEGIAIKAGFGKCDAPPLVMTRNVDGVHYVMCYNRSGKKLKWHFSAENGCQAATLVFEKLTIQARNSRISDVLPPGKLRIYRLDSF